MANKKDTPKVDDVEARVTAMMDMDSSEPLVPPPLPEAPKKTTKATSITVTEPDSEPLAAEPVTEPSAETDDVVVTPIAIDTPESDEAIADIVAEEADTVLAAEDAGIEATQTAVEPNATEPRKHGHPVLWFIIAVLVMVAGLTAYLLLNPSV